MRNRAALICLILLALLDDLIGLVAPVDFTYHSLSFIPHFCFIGLMLIVYARTLTDRILISALTGILTDYFFMSTFPKHFLLYTIMGICIGFFQTWMEESDRIKATCIMAAIFLIELIPYAWNVRSDSIILSLHSWLIYQGILTFSLNGLAVILLIYIFNVYGRYEAIQRIRSQRIEKNRYRNMRLKRK